MGFGLNNSWKWGDDADSFFVFKMVSEILVENDFDPEFDLS
jgi:hypothetical protein